jgi:hypothetical protein
MDLRIHLGVQLPPKLRVRGLALAVLERMDCERGVILVAIAVDIGDDEAAEVFVNMAAIPGATAGLGEYPEVTREDDRYFA